VKAVKKTDLFHLIKYLESVTVFFARDIVYKFFKKYNNNKANVSQIAGVSAQNKK